MDKTDLMRALTALGSISIERVEEICDAERDGRVVVLPRKVGDTVNTKRGKAEVVAWDTTARVKIIGEPDFVKRYRDYDIGSKIFTAEAALKGASNGN